MHVRVLIYLNGLLCSSNVDQLLVLVYITGEVGRERD